MNETGSDGDELFRVSAETRISAAPGAVYAVVSDLPRSGEWSTECRGGRWVSGEPGAVGAVFRGENFRSGETVPWAPVVRGKWATDAEVVAADPGRTFRWAMRSDAGRVQESVWAFDLSGSDGECILAHRFWMGEATEGIRRITAEMGSAERERFFADWRGKLEQDMSATVARIKRVVEDS